MNTKLSGQIANEATELSSYAHVLCFMHVSGQTSLPQLEGFLPDRCLIKTFNLQFMCFATVDETYSAMRKSCLPRVAESFQSPLRKFGLEPERLPTEIIESLPSVENSL